MKGARPVYLCDGVRTPFGRYRGGLSAIRTDDLAALPLRRLVERHPGIEAAVDDVILGCANQAGEDNRNVARMAALLAGLPVSVPGVTVNRLCASGLEAVGQAARAIALGEADLMLAGGVEGMSRAPYVMGKADVPFGRDQKLEDTTLGWRFVNPAMAALHGVDSMSQTAENLAREHGIARADQDAFALRSQQRAAKALANGRLAIELMPAGPCAVDEQPRADTTLAKLAALAPLLGADGTITAGNASGLNDGATAVVVMTAQRAQQLGLTPLARIASYATVALDPSIMGMGPVPASKKALERAGWKPQDLDLLEINEAFAAQACAVNNEMGWDTSKVNVNGGAIAIGHPIGASGCRILVTLLHEMGKRNAKKGIASLCIGGGMGVAMCVER